MSGTQAEDLAHWAAEHTVFRSVSVETGHYSLGGAAGREDKSGEPGTFTVLNTDQYAWNVLINYLRVGLSGLVSWNLYKFRTVIQHMILAEKLDTTSSARSAESLNHER